MGEPIVGLGAAKACRLAFANPRYKRPTTHVEALPEPLRDGGSIPPASMDIPSPLKPGNLQGSSRAVARLSVLSVTLRADVANATFQLAEYSQKR